MEWFCALSVFRLSCSDAKRHLCPFVCPCRVFGAGYPGLPTMTVDDWYEQRRRQGVVSAQSAPRRAPGTERQSGARDREFGKSLEQEGEQGCVRGVKHPLAEEE